MRIENPPRDLPTIVARRFERSMGVAETFFVREEQRIIEASQAMAHRFRQGGRLLALGQGVWASNAQHVAAAFVHPAIVGKPALPALALTNDYTALSSVNQLHVLARPRDIALGFSSADNTTRTSAVLANARQKGLLTLGLLGGDSKILAENAPDFLFVVKTHDLLVIQETFKTLYHVLWELVHIFFEYEGLLP